jgi:hypothetical protein
MTAVASVLSSRRTKRTRTRPISPVAVPVILPLGVFAAETPLSKAPPPPTCNPAHGSSGIDARVTRVPVRTAPHLTRPAPLPHLAFACPNGGQPMKESPLFDGPGARTASPPQPRRTVPPPESAPDASPVYVSPKELSARWRCSRSQVDRIARREGFARFCFGDGRNSMVRFLRKEVEAYEQTRRV